MLATTYFRLSHYLNHIVNFNTIYIEYIEKTATKFPAR